MRLPDEFVRMMGGILGDDLDKFLVACDEDIPVSVRLNAKVALSPSYRKVEDTAGGFYLDSRPQFTLDPWFHSGVYYVQEASSMYFEALYRKYVSGRVAVLDLCAAPGGKSTHIASLMENGSLLVSNEYVPQRASVLVENMTKWGVTDTIVTNNTPAEFGSRMAGLFDVMVTDVPCSGEGMFRKEPVAVQDWSLDAVTMCAERQQSILTDVWDALRENGILFYSTCTFNRSEDEDNVDWICSELGGELLESRHFFFHDNRGEGFFIAAIRKTSQAPSTRIKPSRRKSKHSMLEALDGDNISLPFGDGTVAVSSVWADLADYMSERMHVLKLGTMLCVSKGRDEVPDVALALDMSLRSGFFTDIDLGLTDALSYLKSEALQISAPKGYCTVSYRGVPMGFVKSLGNRCNNLYPQYWRIRMNIPSEICESPF